MNSDSMFITRVHTAFHTHTVFKINKQSPPPRCWLKQNRPRSHTACYKSHQFIKFADVKDPKRLKTYHSVYRNEVGIHGDDPEVDFKRKKNTTLDIDHNMRTIRKYSKWRNDFTLQKGGNHMTKVVCNLSFTSFDKVQVQTLESFSDTRSHEAALVSFPSSTSPPPLCWRWFPECLYFIAIWSYIHYKTRREPSALTWTSLCRPHVVILWNVGRTGTVRQSDAARGQL